MDGSTPPPNPPKRKWVLYSSPESIAAGQISLFALIEIPVATFVFGWLALHNPWPWTSLLGLLAAPILLLRSDPAMEMGLKMLREWHGRFFAIEIVRDSLWGGIGLGVVIGVLAVLIPHSTVLPEPLSRNLQNVLPVIVIFIGSGVGLASTRWPYSGCVGGMIGVIMGYLLTVVLLDVDGRMHNFQVGIYIVLSMFVFRGERSDLRMHRVFTSSGLIFGFFWKSVIIRIFSCAYHIGSGLLAFSKNWKAVTLETDFSYPPELLPRAGEVSPVFTLAKKSQENYVLHLPFVLPIIYIPALLYRWNIKASWWLWGPVALMLRPAGWGRDEDMRVEMARWAVLPTWSGLAWFTLIVLAALGILNLPSELFGQFKGLVGTLKGLAPPLPSLRAVLVCLFLVALVVFYGAAHWLREPYKKAFESPDEFRKMLPEEKARFAALARTVRISRQVVLALFVFTVWSFALEFALLRWPDQTRHAVWQWLRPWL